MAGCRMTTPIPDCPQPETPIRERAYTLAQSLVIVAGIAANDETPPPPVSAAA